MAHMDRISHLPDELLFKILLSLPTKDVVATMVLSKRWKFLWTLVPRLEYDHNMFQDDRKHRRFSWFVYGSLLLHEAPVLESLLIKLGGKCGEKDIGLWIRTAFNRCVRQLDIEIDRPSILNPVTLPWNLFSGGCRMLVTLKLSNMMLVNASSLQASFPLLKKLSLVNIIRYPSENFVNNFLSSCPILEDLVVEQLYDDNVPVLVVKIPSLKRLLLCKTIEIYYDDDACGFVIDAPCLESFDILDHSTRGFCYVKNNMPQIEYANLDIYYSRVWKVLGTITSVKRLYFCLKSLEEAYPVGRVFNSLVHLTICTCCPEWLNLLMCMLRVSPKLQALKLDQCHYFWFEESCPCWKEPSSVPECLLSSLETLEWVRYEGAKEEKEVVAFIFKSARCLKKATISSKYVNPSKKLEMLKELSFLSRCSSTCHLTFN